jgi:hypothetical protein
MAKAAAWRRKAAYRKKKRRNKLSERKENESRFRHGACGGIICRRKSMAAENIEEKSVIGK